MVRASAVAFLAVGVLLVSFSPGSTSGPDEVANSYGAFLVSRGDMHLHSINSDGATNISVIADVARSRGLSWMTITDHDEIPRPGECEAETDSTFLCLKGQEITTLQGHVTAHGIRSNITTPWANYSLTQAIEEVYQQGGLTFIAHAFEDNGASDYELFGIEENYTGLEIYHGYAGWNQNALSSDMDQLAVQKWDQLLNSGRRIVGIGASDSHDANNTWDMGDLFTLRGAVGYPRNVAYLREFSERGVLEALERGRLWVTDGPELLFSVEGAIPGDEMQTPAGTPLAVTFDGVANVSSTVRLIANGAQVYSQAVGVGTFNLSTSYTPSADTRLRAELRSNNGNLLKGETYLAFANPVYLDVPPYDAAPSPPDGLMAVIDGDDIVLTWNASASADTDHYAVYRAGSPPALDFTWRTARPRTTAWRDRGAAVDGQDHYYVVRAVDRLGHEETNVAMAAKMVFTATVGQNLFSVPLQVANDSAASVLQTLARSGARRFDSADADGWKALYAGRAGDLATLPLGSAFWVNVTAAGEYVIAGAVPPSVTLTLRSGWNLVSYASHTPRTVSNALAGIPWTRVEVGDPGLPPYYLRGAAGGDTLTPGEGLWIHVTADTLWILPA